MIKVSVIIPFYQRDPGVLRRALQSILIQKPGDGVIVNVIVVDDGSPIPAANEVVGLSFAAPFQLRIITQGNAGVAKARNIGLSEMDSDTTYIAFLDSDDSWHEGHLRQALVALEQGNDFYFCDNARDEHHTSYFASCSALLTEIIQKASPDDVILQVSRQDMETIILRDFATQASTTVFRYSLAKDHRFDTGMKVAGEDVIFFMTLINKLKRFCFSPKVMVTCGTGINLYFSNLAWDSEGYFKRLVDGLRAHMLIKQRVILGEENTAWNDAYITKKRRNFAFHVVRSMAKNMGKPPAELAAMAKHDPQLYLWLPYYAVQTVFGRISGKYKPD